MPPDGCHFSMPPSPATPPDDAAFAIYAYDYAPDALSGAFAICHFISLSLLLLFSFMELIFDIIFFRCFLRHDSFSADVTSADVAAFFHHDYRY